MASKATEIYRTYADYFDEETGALLRSGDTPLDYPNQIDHQRHRGLEGDRAGTRGRT